MLINIIGFIISSATCAVMMVSVSDKAMLAKYLGKEVPLKTDIADSVAILGLVLLVLYFGVKLAIDVFIWGLS